MKLVRNSLLVTVLLVLGASSAHAAVAQLTCSSPTLTANVSYFDVGITDAISSGGSGGGTGKVVYNPIDIHTSLVNFQQFLPLATTGRHIPSCTLTTTIKGQTLQYVLTNCMIVSLDAVVAGPRATGDTTDAYVDVKIAFDTLTFTSFGGADDGGSAPTS